MRLKKNDPGAPEFYRSVLARVEAVPTVEAAGVISGIFKEEASGANRLTIEGGDGPLEGIAAALGCSVGSVKQHASRGLATLRNTMGVDDAGDTQEH